MAKCVVPQDVTSVSWKGREFKVGKNRRVELPEESLRDVQPHGVVPERGEEVDGK